jgi:two-component system phosphate regulon response regulator PhoB
MPQAILVVEDEPEIRELLVFTLSRAGFETLEAETAERALQVLNHKNVSLAVVDWMLPGMSGVDLAFRMRQDEFTRETPIIMLTARSEEADKLKSFESGVDDYVTKPFSPRELVARIKALLRRSGKSDERIVEIAGIHFDRDKHAIRINGEAVHTGPTEFSLLEFLATHPDRTYNRSQLLDHVWGRSSYVEERTVDVQMLRLRKLLKPYGLDPLLKTVRGVGYCFSPE